jgi:hypothetical protein
MSLVSDEDILGFFNMEVDGEEVSLITSLRDAAEQWVTDYTHRVFPVTSYVDELYDGNDDHYLVLKQYPIISIDDTIGVQFQSQQFIVPTDGIYGDVLSGETLQLDSTNTSIIHLKKDYGMIYYVNKWPHGIDNITISYTAGYTDVPNDVLLAIKLWVKFLYQKVNEESIGLKDWSVGDVRQNYEINDMPKEVSMILGHYKKIFAYGGGRGR